MLKLLLFLLGVAVIAIAYLFYDSPNQRRSREIARLARESVKRELRGKPKRGYAHVQAGGKGVM